MKQGRKSSHLKILIFLLFYMAMIVYLCFIFACMVEVIPCITSCHDNNLQLFNSGEI